MPESFPKAARVEDHHPKVNENLPTLSNENMLELKEVLDTLDFELLQNIFSRKIGHYLKDGEVKNKIISKESINKNSFMNSIGLYQEDLVTGLRKILINMDKIASVYETKKLRDLFILKLVCHEETHALSHSMHGLFDRQAGLQFEVKVGFQKDVKNFGKMPVDDNTIFEVAKATTEGNFKLEGFFHYFNEGVTDKFAEGIFQEYLAYKMDITKEERNEFEKYTAYENNIFVFDTLSFLLAGKLGMDQEFVEQAFYGSYFGGDDLSDLAIKKALDEIVVPGFSELFNYQPPASES